MSDAPRDGGHGAPSLKRRPIVIGIVLAASMIGGMFLLAGSIEGFPHTIRRLRQGDPAWLALGAALELLSIVGYSVLFWSVVARGAPRVGWRASLEIPLAGIAALRLLATGGAGGFAVSAWALGRAGMRAREIGSRLVAAVVIQYAVYMLALIVCGVGLWVGLFEGGGSFAITIGPAAFAAAAVLAVLAVALLPDRLARWPRARALAERLRSAAAPAAPDSRRGARDGRGSVPGSRRSPLRVRLARSLRGGAAATRDGVRAAIETLTSPRLDLRTTGLLGAVAYWGFDVAVLWTSFRAFGATPPLAVVVMGYFLGTLAGLLPLPGGIGGIEGGMVGAFAAFGVSAGHALIAVLAYRVISFWLPTLPGIGGYLGLRRTVRRWGGEDGGSPPQGTRSAGPEHSATGPSSICRSDGSKRSSTGPGASTTSSLKPSPDGATHARPAGEARQ
jgi:uncharacterized membrane protein YbhN (UPF0104 family)